MPSDVDAVVADVARAIDAELPRLTAELTDLFVEVIPEFRHDEAVRQLMVASTSSNLVAIVHMLAHSIPLAQITVPPAAAEYARRFAQHSLSLEALMTAYRLGEHEFVQWGITAVERTHGLSTHLALTAVSELARRTHSYIDQVAENLMGIYEEERKQWDSRTGAAHAARIRLVLESEHLSVQDAEHLLGIPLGGWNVAAIAWLEPNQSASEGQLRTAARLLQQASGRQPLTMLPDERTLWAWVRESSPGSLHVDGLRQGVAEVGGGLQMSLGAPGKGLAGFRTSLREAIRARAVAENAENAGCTLVVFDDVAVAGLLTHHVGDLQSWMVRVLGGLAEDNALTRELRATLRVFLESDGSFTRAAQQLHVHKNTVHYRVRKAERLRGRPVSESRLDLEVALAAASSLGKRLMKHE